MNKIERAAIYKFKKKNRFLIHGRSSLKMGGGIATEPFIWLDYSIPFSKVVKDLIFALSKTQIDLPAPSNWNEFKKQFLKNIGLKTQRDLSKDTLYVSVTKIDGMLTFIPMRSLGNGGFEDALGEKIVISENDEVEKIYLSLNEAFAKCE